MHVSFETGGYVHPDTMDFFKRYIKYGDGLLQEVHQVRHVRQDCNRTRLDVPDENRDARRMHVVRSTLSIAIVRTTANTLLHGANTLLVTGHTF